MMSATKAQMYKEKRMLGLFLSLYGVVGENGKNTIKEAMLKIFKINSDSLADAEKSKALRQIKRYIGSDKFSKLDPTQYDAYALAELLFLENSDSEIFNLIRAQKENNTFMEYFADDPKQRDSYINENRKLWVIDLNEKLEKLHTEANQRAEDNLNHDIAAFKARSKIEEARVLEKSLEEWRKAEQRKTEERRAQQQAEEEPIRRQALEERERERAAEERERAEEENRRAEEERRQAEEQEKAKEARLQDPVYRGPDSAGIKSFADNFMSKIMDKIIQEEIDTQEFNRKRSDVFNVTYYKFLKDNREALETWVVETKSKSACFMVNKAVKDQVERLQNAGETRTFEEALWYYRTHLQMHDLALTAFRSYYSANAEVNMILNSGIKDQYLKLERNIFQLKPFEKRRAAQMEVLETLKDKLRESTTLSLVEKAMILDQAYSNMLKELQDEPRKAKSSFFSAFGASGTSRLETIVGLEREKLNKTISGMYTANQMQLKLDKKQEILAKLKGNSETNQLLEMVTVVKNRENMPQEKMQGNKPPDAAPKR